MHYIPVSQHFWLEWRQRLLAQARLIAALQIFDGEEGLLIANAGVLARNRHFPVNCAQVDFGGHAAFGVYPSHNDIITFDSKTLRGAAFRLVIQVSQRALFVLIERRRFGGIASNWGRRNTMYGAFFIIR